MLAVLWERGLPRLRDRLAVLDQAAAAASAGTLPREIREQAAATAHKLAGSLGMFGYPEGTGFAREIEVLLETTGDVEPLALQALIAALRQSLNVQA